LARDAERRAELTEHLAELRSRIVRCVVYTALGAVIVWCYYDWVMALLTHPMTLVLNDIGSKFLLTGFPEAFLIRMQICIVGGVVLTFPLVSLEIWGFVAPGLTPQERKPLKWVVPLSLVLFVGGVLLCYSILPEAFGWFASFKPENADLKPGLQSSILFAVKMMLAFGVVFQLPVVLTLLAKVGVVTSGMLWANWRTAMVVVSAVAAVATPSNDAFSMLMMAIPVAGLYFVSIALVRAVEVKRRKR